MANNNILVCVTEQKTCERLINFASQITKGAPELFVLHVSKTDKNILNNSSECEALDYLFTISKSAGASMTVLRSDNIIDTIYKFIIDNTIKTVVLGKSPDNNGQDAFSRELKSKFSNYECEIIIV